MFADVYDSERIIHVSFHASGPLTDADVEQITSHIERSAHDAEARGDAPVTSLVIVESTSGPSAIQRKRIGEAAAKVQRGCLATVTPHLAIRMIMTAIRWVAGARHGVVEREFGSYEDARRWLVAQSGHPAGAFDALYEQAKRLTRA